MMEMSRRARRMQRHRKRNKVPALSLVSLMDIFTILVFFLLVNSTSSQQTAKKGELVLPASVSQNVPQEQLTITVTKNQVLVGGRKVGAVAALMASAGDSIPEIKKELEFYSDSPSVSIQADQNQENAKAVTILADENTPYELVSKILSTCQQANYTNISFAATQKAKAKLAR